MPSKTKNQIDENAFAFLRTNERTPKPRKCGVTEIRGPYYTPLGKRQLEDILEMMGKHVDALKFAGGSFSLIPRHALTEIISLCHDHDVLCSTGGFIEHVLTLHAGDHQVRFLTNIQHNPRICVEVGEIGAVHRGKPYTCNSALVYSSVIVFGAVRLIDDRALKTWFFERIMAKYGEEGWTFEPGYPQLNRIILYEQKMEIVTGKHSAGLYH